MAFTEPAGWYVISLRPQGGHAALRRAAARRGAGLLALSPWRIEVQPEAATGLALALAADNVLFTSPAAVACAARLAPLRARPRQNWLAVGSGTAAALRRAGVGAVISPQRMDSEGLLQLPQLQHLQGRSVGLVTAPDGRGVLAPALQARGARLHRADVYRRVAVAIPERAIERLRQLPAPACLLLSSGAALTQAMASLPDDARRRLLECAVAAASDRLAEQAAAAGFQRIVRAAGPRPAQLLDAAVAAIAGRIR
ncbi:uroporphyrinogen-III synthase [Pseudoxanthomonas wuyuanensis]|uniref:Uroporphyrinogen-III synthase n=1 Tax=Pseudoxanthomonas wuyuanensis TaxID=1073196 RepID=A0A286D9T7_9GAMM|nr:uroporphyrinogen-III synthase [Pseudoxanthomonas wuyuanensis]KAF1719498.1 uroporphyrinogen-III synthase [Pseudoxanthomonas wuyuanensis]SOD55393.1 uroporphyrinogen-III synthase [Pseudoxanthomonas wuyuanensis]